MTVPVVSGPATGENAACRTVTLIDAFVSKSVPSNNSVKVACVPVSRTTLLIVVPAGAPLSVKSVVNSDASYVALVIVTVTVAPLRLVSVSDAGFVPVIAALSSTVVTVTVPVVTDPVTGENAACKTVTLSDAFVSKSVPSNASVKVACVPVSRATLLIVVPAGAPLSVKSVVNSDASYVALVISPSRLPR